jgi:hypothetical protein
MDRPSPPTTILRPPWLHLARGVWLLLTVAAVVFFVIGANNQMRQPLPACTVPGAACGPWEVSREDVALAGQLGWPDGFINWAIALSMWTSRIAFVSVALLIFWRKSNDWMALALSLLLTTWVVEGLWDVGVLLPGVNGVYMVANAIFALLPFLFPNGRFVPGWTRWPAIMFAILFNLALSWPPATVAVSILWFGFAVYAVLYRYRRVSTPVERQQTKWVLIGLMGTMIVVVPMIVVLTVYPPSQPSPGRLAFMLFAHLPLSTLSLLMLPISLVIAIFRYRLWDIDILIRRTLQYTLITALLALVYFGSVVLLQAFFGSFAGEQSPVVIVLSTLLIAALFTPVRRRVQALIDRRFFRKKYDAAQVLAQFARTARDETDLDSLTAALSQVVDETIQPEGVGIWLKR